jgi:hypothetical protein
MQTLVCHHAPHELLCIPCAHAQLFQLFVSLQYLQAVFRAGSNVITIGYGVEAPLNQLDMTCVLLSMACGAGLWALMMGMTASLLQRKDLSSTMFVQELQLWKVLRTSTDASVLQCSAVAAQVSCVAVQVSRMLLQGRVRGGARFDLPVVGYTITVQDGWRWVAAQLHRYAPHRERIVDDDITSCVMPDMNCQTTLACLWCIMPVHRRPGARGFESLGGGALEQQETVLPQGASPRVQLLPLGRTSPRVTSLAWCARGCALLHATHNRDDASRTPNDASPS